MKLTLTVGLPASGKTTWARDKAKKDGNIRLVSRDDIRTTLYGRTLGYKHTKEKEEAVSKVALEIVNMCLAQGKNVIIHDTNLRFADREPWRVVAAKFGACFELEYFDVSIHKLLERNHSRGEKAIPVSILWAMYERYKKLRGWKPIAFDKRLPPAVIFDVDGTLVHIGQRSPFDFSKVKDDPANVPVQELFKMYQDQGYECLVVSARSNVGDCFKDTLENLAAGGCVPAKMYMRKEGDSRPDMEVKEDILHEIAQEYNPIVAVDDRDTPVGMWRMHGITCLQVGYGDF